MAGEDFKVVKVSVGGSTKNIQMQKGVLIQNKGGSYCVFDDGSLKFKKTGTNVWEDVSQINMTNYQWKAFQNIMNNDENANSFSKADIEKAMKLYGDGKFVEDMKKDLPSGYSLEKPKKNTAEKYVEIDVTNGKESQSARLRFQIAEMEATKTASQAQNTNAPSQPSVPHTRPKKVSPEHMAHLADKNGNFVYDISVGGRKSTPIPIDGWRDGGALPVDKKLAALSGKPLTPDLIDQVINIIYDCAIAEAKANKHNDVDGVIMQYGYMGEGQTETNSPLADAAEYVDYLKPATLNKIFQNSNRIGMGSYPSSVEGLKKLYARLTPKQKEQYYEKLYSDASTVYDGYTYSWYDQGFAYAILEPLEGKNYENLKKLLLKHYRENGNGMEVVRILYEEDFITREQAEELLDITDYGDDYKRREILKKH